MKLLIKFPTRSRPQKFKNTFNKYYDFLSGKNNVEFIITMDLDDTSMNNEKMKNFLDRPGVKYFYGKHKNKVEAINDNINNTDFDILLLASDDMIPKVHDYDDIICKRMKKFFPQLDGALHFNDGRTGRRLITISIMGKKLYDYFGYIYHPDYFSLWCDNEFSKVVIKKKKVVYFNSVIISHDWTNYTGKDKLHKRNESFYKRDNRIFLQRQRRGFPRNSIIK